MLPGVSASDNLYADLGVDPSSPGMQNVDATDLLLRRRLLDHTSGAIIYGVGCVGDASFRRAGSSNTMFAAFVQQLLQTYDEAHRVALYVAGMRPIDRPIVHVHTLGELAAMGNETVQRHVPAVATMYVPSTRGAPLDEAVLEDRGLEIYRSFEEGTENGTIEPFGYGVHELQALANLSS